MRVSGRQSLRRASICLAGALGLIHKHVTGALPIRRNTKDPAYLITLKAYVAELLRKHDLFFYPEGGRSYSGELKSSKTGLFSAALAAEVPNLAILPTAIAYDLVLEDHILARQATKRGQRPFRRELAEMVRFAVGYRSRAFVTFGRAIPVDGYDYSSRRAILDLAHHVRAEVGRLYKVLPTALMAAAMRPSITRADLTARIDALLDTLRALGANVDVTSGEAAIEAAAEPFEARSIIVWTRDASGYESGTCCATTRDRFSTCSRPLVQPTDARFDFEGFFSFTRTDPISEAAGIALRHVAARFCAAVHCRRVG